MDNVGWIDETSFPVLAAERLDSFFFVERNLLAMIIKGVVNIVDWRTSEVIRRFEIKDLYSPMLRGGIDQDKTWANYWHDRREGKVKFVVGKFSRKDAAEEKPTDKYLTILGTKLFNSEICYGGWFKDSVLYGEGEEIAGESKLGGVLEALMDYPSNNSKERMLNSSQNELATQSGEEEKEFEMGEL